MTPGIRPLVAGNWKMNGIRSSLKEITTVAGGIDDNLGERIDVLICPPATLVYLASAAVLDTHLRIGAQDCHPARSGAHTGDLSAAMMRDAEAKYIIVGHSERRTDHAETDELVRSKAEACHAEGLTAIICIGETEAERKDGRTLDVLERQLNGSVPEQSTAANTVVAYEPVWAIGTGLTPTAGDVEKAHAFIRHNLENRLGDAGATMRLLYGGSVKPGNAGELMSITNVDGALVGGASLKADDFLAICGTYR